MILNLQEVLNVPCLIPMYKNVGLHPNSDNQVTDFFIYLNSSLDGLQRIVIAFIIVVLVISHIRTCTIFRNFSDTGSTSCLL